MIQSEETSDGWLFVDQDGNPVHLSGDMKAIRVAENHVLFDKYIEYHLEFEIVSYQEKLALRNGTTVPTLKQ